VGVAHDSHSIDVSADIICFGSLFTHVEKVQLKRQPVAPREARTIKTAGNLPETLAPIPVSFVGQCLRPGERALNLSHSFPLTVRHLHLMVGRDLASLRTLYFTSQHARMMLLHHLFVTCIFLAIFTIGVFTFPSAENEVLLLSRRHVSLQPNAVSEHEIMSIEGANVEDP